MNTKQKCKTKVQATLSGSHYFVFGDTQKTGEEDSFLDVYEEAPEEAAGSPSC